jgi:DNA-binding NarL/FixJ family response regulator
MSVPLTPSKKYPDHDPPTPRFKSNGKIILTDKELRVLELLSYGFENHDIAEHFRTTKQAVKNMLHTINLKLGADNRTHAVAICFRKGWFASEALRASPIPPQPRQYPSGRASIAQDLQKE